METRHNVLELEEGGLNECFDRLVLRGEVVRGSDDAGEDVAEVGVTG